MALSRVLTFPPLASWPRPGQDLERGGSYGGLWRRLGRPPQQLVGVGFSTQGEYKGYPYRFLDGILDPRVAFMREGMAEQAVPGTVLGERGLMGGGAAGHELDRADVQLGTPHHAIIVGRAVVEDPTFRPSSRSTRNAATILGPPRGRRSSGPT